MLKTGSYETEAEVLRAEQNLIDLYIKNPYCLNLNPNAAKPPGWSGKNLSDQHKVKLMKAAANPIIAISPTGEVTQYNSPKQAGKKLGLCRISIVRLLRSGKPGKQQSMKGWRFEKVENNV